MTAFCRLEFFEHDLLYKFERVFLFYLNQFLDEEERKTGRHHINAQTLVTMYSAHQVWSEHMMVTYHGKRQLTSRSIFDQFKDHSFPFQHLLLQALNQSEIDLKGYFMIIGHSNLQRFKKRPNTKLVL